MSVAAPPKHECARCGDIAPRATRANGGLCRKCYNADPSRFETCAKCGRLQRPSARNSSGKALCGNCARPKRVCAGCGKLDHTKATTAVGGSLCQRCYTRPERACGKCGTVAPIALRAQHGATDLCHRCAENRQMPCGICEQTRPVHTHWPLGAVCTSCYRHAIRNPQQCLGCGNNNVLINRTRLGVLTCGPCAGSTTNYVCLTCGQAGEQHYAGTCLTCSVTRLTNELITVDGVTNPGLSTLPNTLARRGKPASTLRWLTKAGTALLLRALAQTDGQINHAALDACPPIRGRHYLRAILVEADVLPRREEPIEQFETWIDELVATLPGHHASLINPYAHWVVLRTARRNARRRYYTQTAADSGRERIRTAIRLLNHLEAQGKKISDLTQSMLDQWTAGNRDRTAKIAGFIQWLGTHGQTSGLTIQLPRQTMPSEIGSEADHHQRIGDLLTGNTAADLGTRVAGLLVLLYGARLTQIQQLTTASITTSGGNLHLALGQHPLELPNQLGMLVGQLAGLAEANPRGQSHDGKARYLFPGGHPGTHIHLVTLSRKLTAAGIPARISRNYALTALAGHIPAAVMATQLGLHPTTTTGWARFSQRDSGAYLAARQHDQLISSIDADASRIRNHHG